MSAERGKTKLALYRKYRPTKLADVIGQPQVTDILAAMAEQHNFAQAYLFTGQRGTGKTTVARILAHLINDTPYNNAVDSSDIDIIEIDAASNNSVDDVREIRDGVQLAPMKSSHKVYIIDEFHMLSKAAFNALLKTIEEPPEYVVFILATTELQKVPATILSRVQRFHFKPVAEPILVEHLKHIANSEQIKADDDALHLIARAGGGSVRDSISLLDQLSNSGEITKSRVIDTLGLVPDELLDDIMASVSAGDAKGVITTVRNILDGGTTPEALANGLISRLEATALDNPTNYQLIDRLLEVRGAAIPSAKLLAILVTDAQPSAPRTTVHTIKPPKSATLKESPRSVKSKSAAAKSIDLDWDDLVAQIKADDQPSIVSVLDQCDHRYDKTSGKLTLYFGKKFFRDQAKSAVFNDALAKASNELYGAVPAIAISDSPAPTDSGVAAVLSTIGGELTKVDDGTE